MSILAHEPLSCKSFVSVQRNVTVAAHLTAAQAADVMRRLIACFPDLAVLSERKQLQVINQPSRYSNCRSWFRIAAVCGGQLPAELTTEDVLATIAEVVPCDGFTLSAFFDESERRPEMTDPPSGSEPVMRWNWERLDSPAARQEYRKRPVNWIAA